MGEPELHRIQNPAALFRMEEDIQATGYIVQEAVWRDRRLASFPDATESCGAIC